MGTTYRAKGGEMPRSADGLADSVLCTGRHAALSASDLRSGRPRLRLYGTSRGATCKNGARRLVSLHIRTEHLGIESLSGFEWCNPDFRYP